MYCKNCGSILQSNANFCHVCGTKVDIVDVFGASEPKKEEPTFDMPKEENTYRSYYDSYEVRREDVPDTPSKKPLVPALIGSIGTLFLMGDAGLTYLTTMLQLNEYYTKGVFAYTDYLEYVLSLLRTVGLFLALATVLGGVLGSVAVVFAKKQSHKKAFIFGCISIVLAVASLVLSIIAFVYLAKLG